MKLQQKDIALIIIALVASLIMAYVANKYIFSTSNANTQVDVVPVIHSDFATPSKSYFNQQAVDPTQIINIAPNNSQQPFNSGH